MASSQWLLLQRSQKQLQQRWWWKATTTTISSSSFHRFYNTRAHPNATPLLPLPHALFRLLRDGEQRIKNNHQVDERLQSIAELKGKKKRTVRGYPDETIELALNLNLDPRQPGQSLRGSLELPHGTGKKGHSVLVFTTDVILADQARAAGAQFVGGESLIDDVMNGTVSPGDAFTVALATLEMIPILQKKGAARLLGPRGLMPNVKSGTCIYQLGNIPSGLIN
jgi:Ribosomal protein L1p/L10e family